MKTKTHKNKIKKTFYFSPWFIKFGSIGRDTATIKWNSMNANEWKSHTDKALCIFTERRSQCMCVRVWFSFIASFRVVFLCLTSTKWWPFNLLGILDIALTIMEHFHAQHCMANDGSVGRSIDRSLGCLMPVYLFVFVDRSRVRTFFSLALSMLCSQC